MGPARQRRKSWPDRRAATLLAAVTLLLLSGSASGGPQPQQSASGSPSATAAPQGRSYISFTCVSRLDPAQPSAQQIQLRAVDRYQRFRPVADEDGGHRRRRHGFAVLHSPGGGGRPQGRKKKRSSWPALLWKRDPFGARTRSLLGIRYFIGAKPRYPDQVEVFKGATGHTVYQYPVTMPRVWSVHQATQVSDEEATRMLIDPAVDLASRTFSTVRPPALEQCAGSDTVELKRHMANRVSIDARMACRGLVVLDDQYAPGWKATVDGKTVPIIDAYGLVRGVPVDAGSHVVEFRYRPLSVMAGGTLTALAMMIALSAGLRSRSLRTRSDLTRIEG